MRTNILWAAAVAMPTSLLAGSALAGGLNSPVIEVVQPVASTPDATTPNFQGFAVYGGATSGSNNYDIVGDGDLSTGGQESPPLSFDFNLPDLGGEGFGGIIGLSYDFQPSTNLIYGLFLDYSLSNITNDTTVNVEVPDSFDIGFEYDLKQTSALTIGGRVGFLPSAETLVYGLVGYTRAEWEGTLGLDGDSESYTFDNNGLTIGAGIETFVASNVTARIEYRYTSFDDYELISESFPEGSVGVDLETNSQSVAATLSYRF